MLEAEARGEFEKLSKKAEGLKQIVEACGGADQAYRLLMLERIETLADKAAGAISNIKFDKVVLWGGAAGNGTNGGAATGVSSFVTDLMGTLPPALHTMMNIGGVKIAEGLFKVEQDPEDERIIDIDELASDRRAPGPIRIEPIDGQ
jgi:flotillin